MEVDEETLILYVRKFSFLNFSGDSIVFQFLDPMIQFSIAFLLCISIILWLLARFIFQSRSPVSYGIHRLVNCIIK